MEKIQYEKGGVTAKWLRVSIGKTNIKRCKVGSGKIKGSGKWSFGAGYEQIDPILCYVKSGFRRNVGVVDSLKESILL